MTPLHPNSGSAGSCCGVFDNHSRSTLDRQYGY
jgi:hypothetical protein